MVNKSILEIRKKKKKENYPFPMSAGGAV